MEKEIPRDPQQDEQRKDAKAEEARKQLDEIPAPGTDPLHEGP